MILVINGQSRTIPDKTSLHQAVALLCKNPALVIAELNGTILDQSLWPATSLNPDDKLELITFVGGG